MKRVRDKLVAEVAKRVNEVVPVIIGLPGKLFYVPFVIATDFVGSSARGFGVPKLISDVSGCAVVAVAAVGTYDLALDVGRKIVCARECKTCNGWNALQCTMCKGTGKVKYKVKNYTLRRGEKAAAKSIADAITKNRAELVHFPASMDSDIPLPCKDCPTCDGSCVMACPGCKQKHPLRISEDDNTKR